MPANNPSIASGARAPDLDHLSWLGEHTSVGLGDWAGKALLDLGCGSGFLCAEAARQGARHVVGIDLKSPDVEAKDWRFCTVDLEADDWTAEVPRAQNGHSSFDLICAFDILEHLSSPVKFLNNCRNLLSSGGHLVLTTPNTASWERLLKGEAWSGATDPQHKILFSRYSLAFLLRRTGFHPMVLNAPVRKLARAHIPCPQVGAQIFCVATVNSAQATES